MHIRFIQKLLLLSTLATMLVPGFVDGQESAKPIRIGIIGLDTSHSIAFTKLLHRDSNQKKKFRVVCAYPHGSADIKSSTSRIPKYTQQIKSLGVKIVDSIDALIAEVDAVLLETNDGRIHLKQAIPVLKAKKPVFIDKPLAASLPDVIAIYDAAAHFGTPVFSSSSLRFAKPALKARTGELVGDVLGCTTFSPAKLEPTHPDLYWYGIHGVEQLFTVLGPGCKTVSRSSTDSTDVVVGIWNNGRIGTFRGTRTGPHKYGGTVFGSKGNASTGGNEGYGGLVDEIKNFFASGISPVPDSETIEIYAFMSAADVSKSKNGAPVSLKKIIAQARVDATARLKQLGVDFSNSKIECRETDDAITVTKAGKPMFKYHKSIQQPPKGIDKLFQRSGYIHPLRTPSGRIVTGDFAPDHPHQHGIFLAWVNTRFDGRNIDFWNQKKKTGRISHVKVHAVNNSKQKTGFTVELVHEDISNPKAPAKVLREQWDVDVHARGFNFSVIDLRSRQTCIAKTPLKLQKHHYGGVGIRGSSQWFNSNAETALAKWKQENANKKKSDFSAPPDATVMGHGFLTSQGLERHNGNHTKAKWVAMYGRVDGKWAGIAVLCHPDNFRAPQHVRLHPSKPYFSYVPVVPGDFQIKPNETYETRLRIIAFDGKPDVALLNKEWADFSNVNTKAK